MKTLDISKIHIIATEWNSSEPIDRIYVVAKTPDGVYDDPMTCVVEFDQNRVFAKHPFHQFLKFSYPVPLEVSEQRIYVLKQQLLTLSIGDQRKLMFLYNPDIYSSPEKIVSADTFEYVKTKLLIPLSQEEFNNIETGFKLHFNYSTAQEVGEFKWAVGQYLTSIESPMDRKKMDRVVELILEYLEGIGQWQRNYPF